jgi:tetratricopeptide (TPR) repeat protein
MWIILFAVIIAICLVWLFFIILKKLPEVGNLDVASMQADKQDRARLKILEAKLSRSGQKIKIGLSKAVAPVFGVIGGRLKKFKETVTAWEEKYRQKPKKERAHPKTLDELFVEIDELMAQDDLAGAEKKAIEVIARNKKNLRAYEALGNIYFTSQSWDQAEEVYKYLIKLLLLGDQKKSRTANLIKSQKLEDLETSFLGVIEVDPKIAIYYYRLGEVFESNERWDKALDSFLKSSTVEPNNPKYLDKIIELAIKVGDSGLAKKTCRHLKKINPENSKVEEYREALDKL